MVAYPIPILSYLLTNRAPVLAKEQGVQLKILCWTSLQQGALCDKSGKKECVGDVKESIQRNFIRETNCGKHFVLHPDPLRNPLSALCAHTLVSVGSDPDSWNLLLSSATFELLDHLRRRDWGRSLNVGASWPWEGTDLPDLCSESKARL